MANGKKHTVEWPDGTVTEVNVTAKDLEDLRQAAEGHQKSSPPLMQEAMFNTQKLILRAHKDAYKLYIDGAQKLQILRSGFPSNTGPAKMDALATSIAKEVVSGSVSIEEAKAFKDKKFKDLKMAQGDPVPKAEAPKAPWGKSGGGGTNGDEGRTEVVMRRPAAATVPKSPNADLCPESGAEMFALEDLPDASFEDFM